MIEHWETFVRSHFPGYLLPNSAVSGISPEEAARFLERITGRPHELALLRAASTLSPRVEDLCAFSLQHLPDLARTLHSRADTTTREWDGGFHGRLAIRQTLEYRMAGAPTRFVTLSRQRSYALPENVLVRAVAERLSHLLGELRQAGVIAAYGWSAEAQGCEGKLKHLLASSMLRDVPRERVGPSHEQAARAAKHPGYAAALGWYRALKHGLDEHDLAATAAVLAEGALTPMKDFTRFEIAVLVRLLQALWSKLSLVAGWKFHRCLVHPNRDEVAIFECDGARVRVFYNQAHLDSGACELGARHYFGNPGRMRPDLTVVTERGNDVSAAVVEVKMTAKPETILAGFHEAMLYRWEYANVLRGWPKAILVTSCPISGSVRNGDDVVAIGWDAWVPDEVVEGLVSRVVS